MIKKKVVMLGSWGVGKTSLVRQFIDHVFDEKYLSTLGVKIDKKQVTSGEREVDLVLWDIAGAEDNFSVPMHYVKGAAGYLLIIDGTRRASLEKALDLVNMVEKEVGQLPFVAAVNKSDLNWELTAAEIDAAFGKPGQQWFTTSAKTGENVEAVFSAITERLIA